MISVIAIWFSVMNISAPRYQRETWYSNVLVILVNLVILVILVNLMILINRVILVKLINLVIFVKLVILVLHCPFWGDSGEVG